MYHDGQNPEIGPNFIGQGGQIYGFGASSDVPFIAPGMTPWEKIPKPFIPSIDGGYRPNKYYKMWDPRLRADAVYGNDQQMDKGLLINDGDNSDYHRVIQHSVDHSQQIFAVKQAAITKRALDALPGSFAVIVFAYIIIKVVSLMKKIENKEERSKRRPTRKTKSILKVRKAASEEGEPLVDREISGNSLGPTDWETEDLEIERTISKFRANQQVRSSRSFNKCEESASPYTWSPGHPIFFPEIGDSMGSSPPSLKSPETGRFQSPTPPHFKSPPAWSVPATVFDPSPTPPGTPFGIISDDTVYISLTSSSDVIP